MTPALILPKMTETYSFWELLEVAACLFCCVSVGDPNEKIVERVSHLDCSTIVSPPIPIAPDKQLCILKRISTAPISESPRTLTTEECAADSKEKESREVSSIVCKSY